MDRTITIHSSKRPKWKLYIFSACTASTAFCGANRRSKKKNVCETSNESATIPTFSRNFFFSKKNLKRNILTSLTTIRNATKHFWKVKKQPKKKLSATKICFVLKKNCVCCRKIFFGLRDWILMDKKSIVWNKFLYNNKNSFNVFANVKLSWSKKKLLAKSFVSFLLEDNHVT